MSQLTCNCAVLRSASRALTMAYDEALRPTGLRVTQFSILSRVAAIGPMPVSQLAGRLAMDRTTLGRNLKPLEREGLVSLDVGADRRERLITLTPAGRLRYGQAVPLWQRINERFEARFGTEQAHALRVTLKSVVRAGRELCDQVDQRPAA